VRQLRRAIAHVRGRDREGNRGATLLTSRWSSGSGGVTKRAVKRQAGGGTESSAAVADLRARVCEARGGCGAGQWESRGIAAAFLGAANRGLGVRA
jgi:hypothetical protein